MKLEEWSKNKYFQCKFCEKLQKECEDLIERINFEDLTLEDFLENYEKRNKPLIIRNLTKKFFKESQWNYEVLKK